MKGIQEDETPIAPGNKSRALIEISGLFEKVAVKNTK